MTTNTLRQRGTQILLGFRDREYYNRLFEIAFPIALQQFIMSSLNMVGMIMIGQLGEVSVAAVGLANQIFFIGAFRAGGDIRFAFFLDAGTIWVVGVPLAFLGAFYFHLPVYWVYLLVMADEVTKLTIGAFRFFSKKWIHNLTEAMRDL